MHKAANSGALIKALMVSLWSPCEIRIDLETSERATEGCNQEIALAPASQLGFEYNLHRSSTLNFSYICN